MISVKIAFTKIVERCMLFVIGGETVRNGVYIIGGILFVIGSTVFIIGVIILKGLP